MAKAKRVSNWNGKASEVQTFVRGQLEEAQKRFVALEVEAEKVLTTLVQRSRESRKGLDGLLGQITPGEWLQAPAVQEMGKRAEAASTEVRKRLDHLQNRVVEAVGVASQSQVKEITRELAKLSRKVDALVLKKPGKSASRA